MMRNNINKWETCTIKGHIIWQMDRVLFQEEYA